VQTADRQQAGRQQQTAVCAHGHCTLYCTAWLCLCTDCAACCLLSLLCAAWRVAAATCSAGLLAAMHEQTANGVTASGPRSPHSPTAAHSIRPVRRSFCCRFSLAFRPCSHEQDCRQSCHQAQQQLSVSQPVMSVRQCHVSSGLSVRSCAAGAGAPLCCCLLCCLLSYYCCCCWMAGTSSRSRLLVSGFEPRTAPRHSSAHSAHCVCCAAAAQLRPRPLLSLSGASSGPARWRPLTVSPQRRQQRARQAGQPRPPPCKQTQSRCHASRRHATS
jgi:hypothetical protein